MKVTESAQFSAEHLEFNKLQAEIRRWRFWLPASMGASLLIYILWFWGMNDTPLADKADAWGQFGDFIGGIFNPLVAFAAFYWLTRSVLLQKQELADTKKALQEASKAQTEQALHSAVTVRLSALSALTNSIMSEVQVRQSWMAALRPELGFSSSPSTAALQRMAAASVEYESAKRLVDMRLKERLEYETEIKAILEKYTTPSDASNIDPVEDLG